MSSSSCEPKVLETFSESTEDVFENFVLGVLLKVSKDFVENCRNLSGIFKLKSLLNVVEIDVEEFFNIFNGRVDHILCLLVTQYLIDYTSHIV
jgi:hypothetical protein